ncbi:hypothetical protein BH11ARM2_BH11ARM2_06280 [soil metagenome]
MDSLLEMVFLGYRVKRPWEPGPSWAPIERVCCVGENLSEPPEGWIDRWDLNRAACYPTPGEAWATVHEDRVPFRLFAYDFLPVYFEKGEPPEVVSLDEIFENGFSDIPGGRPNLDDMAGIGYDIAEWFSINWPNSPLVNNGFAREFAANRYGLLDLFETAIEACGEINKAMPKHHAANWILRVHAKGVEGPLF